MPHASLPSFPDGLPEIELCRLPLSGILQHDRAIESRLLDICRTQGFFYVDLTETPEGRSLLDYADRLQELAKTAFAIPWEEKAKVSFAQTKCIFGWKPPGSISSMDPHKRKENGQFWNVSKDDILQLKGCKNVAYPSPLKEEIPGLFKDFTVAAHSMGLQVLSSLAKGLGLTTETIVERHRVTEKSGDHIRLTWGPGDPDATAEIHSDDPSTRVTTTGHTDFGSITLLFNWVGGLQIENAATGAWEWVRPLPGHAIVNLGDAMVDFSGKGLKSGKHRVVAAPGDQAQLDRYSVVYFVRPEDDVFMEDLTKPIEAVSDGQKKWRCGEWNLERAKALGVKISAAQVA